MKNKTLLSLCLVAAAAFNSSSVFAHGHPQSEKAKKAAKGIFLDKDVKDRKLSDWEGIWRSVYPLLLDGQLDVVFEKKAKNNKDKTFKEYKNYYKKGYKTDVEVIGIENDVMEFTKNGKTTSCKYAYSGYKILQYVSGKRGVRYLFECKDKKSKAPKFVQFSDHIIEPYKSGHFHIYMGNSSHEKLLKELENWPTYYPYTFSDKKIVHEMLHH